MGGDRNWLENIALVKETLTTAYELAQKSNDTPLMEKLYEARSIILDLQGENQELKERVKNLEVVRDLKENLVFKKNSYWLKQNGIENGPYCSTCFVVTNKLIHLIKGYGSHYQCHNCKTILIQIQTTLICHDTQ
jgi:hypothetical protein